MVQLVITGHGNYASGLSSLIDCIAGEQPHITYIDFPSTSSSNDLEFQFRDVIEKNQGNETLFCCDLIGATPFRLSAMLTKEFPQVHVIGGVNCSALLEILFMKDQNSEELMEHLINTTCQTVLCFNKNKEKKQIALNNQSGL